MSLSNYPPGVTGREYQIAGYPPCARCGHDHDDHDDQALSECCGSPAIEDTEICAKCKDGSGFHFCYGDADCECEEWTDDPGEGYEPDPDTHRI